MLLASKDGTKIYADSVGDPNNKQIVFIHGLALSSAVFDIIFNNADYASHFYMIRYDMRGSGRSDKPQTPGDYSPQKFAEDYTAVAEHFRLKRPVLVGWSMGATVLSDIAQILQKDTLSGAVYLSALPYIGPITHLVGTPTVLGFLPGLMTTDDAVLALQTRVAFVESAFSKDPEAIPARLKWEWAGSSLSIPPAAIQSLFKREQDPSAMFAQGKEGFPLLVLHGTADKQVNGEVLVEQLKPHFTNMTVRFFDGLGHAIFYEDPDAVMDSIAEFVQKVQ